MIMRTEWTTTHVCLLIHILNQPRVYVLKHTHIMPAYAYTQTKNHLSASVYARVYTNHPTSSILAHI